MYLDSNVQNNLRERGLISLDEVVSKEGDLFVAINVVTNERRIIHVDENLLETKSQKKILKG